MDRHPEEFKISIYWSRENVPGFHVTAGWANERNTSYPIDRQRISSEALRIIGNTLDTDFNMDGSFYATVKGASVQHDQAALDHADALHNRIERLKRELADAEAALDNPN